jgi:hypothetical protein
MVRTVFRIVVSVNQTLWREATARRFMRLVLEVRFDEDDYYVQAITKRRASLLVKSFIRLDIGHEKSAGVNRPSPMLCKTQFNGVGGLRTYIRFTRIRRSSEFIVELSPCQTPR